MVGEDGSPRIHTEYLGTLGRAAPRSMLHEGVDINHSFCTEAQVTLIDKPGGVRTQSRTVDCEHSHSAI